MGMSLYQMSDTARQLQSLLESGEIDEAVLLDTMEAIGASQKLEDYVYVLKDFEAQIQMHDAEITRLKENKRILENRVEYLKEKVCDYMKASGQKSANAGTFKLTMRESKSCEIVDESMIPLSYMREIPAKLEPDKKKMLKDMKDGKRIEGADLKTSYSVTVK